MQWLLILKLVVLLTDANGAPVIAAKLFGKFLYQPLDRGTAFVDGRPVFGRSKTVRGIILSLMATAAFAPILGFEWIDDVIIASAAHDRRSVVKLFETAAELAAEQPRDRN